MKIYVEYLFIDQIKKTNNIFKFEFPEKDEMI